ncbi:hypothetical protein LTR37_002303 [Vermiconidia calcicola]|uniref:Uncharacterized protein n=1 Tax=Vermiconidia calcicola TaxID=1690605 RepID=A0ACC3NUY3_9PEZI|nr:hypothetical protein LTR37_002303 [Vermiconidia calcicola]
MAQTSEAPKSVTTTDVFEVYQHGAVALAYYDPPKVFGDCKKGSCVMVDPILVDTSPCLRLRIHDPRGITPRKRAQARVMLSECAKIAYTICDLKRLGRLSEDVGPWADKYGLQLLEIGQPAKKGPQVKYRVLIFKLEGIPISRLRWTGDPLEEMEKEKQEMRYFLADGNASGDAEIIMLFDANLFLPNLQSFLSACDRVQKEKLAPKKPAAAKPPAATKEAPEKAAEPKDTKKTRLQHVEDMILEEMQATYDLLPRDRPSLDDPEFSKKVHDLMNKVKDKTISVKYLLGQKKALTDAVQ